MLHRRLGAGIGGVVRGIGAKQGGHQGADLAVIVDVLAGFAQEEERRLGIDRAHLVVFGLADLGDGFLQHLADGVDGDVRLAHRGDGVGEQLFHGRGAGEIALQRYRLGSGCLQRGDGGVGIGLARGAVVVDGDRLRAVGGEITGDQPAQVLGAAGDEDGLAFDGVVDHGVFLLR